jgi:hypothetical protein
MDSPCIEKCLISQLFDEYLRLGSRRGDGYRFSLARIYDVLRRFRNLTGRGKISELPDETA